MTVNLLDGDKPIQTPMINLLRESQRLPFTKDLNLTQFGETAGLVMALVVSTATALPDQWLAELFQRDATVTSSIYREIAGRFISRSEAFKIARSIMEDAERERLEAAEIEAAHGFVWGDADDL